MHLDVRDGNTMEGRLVDTSYTVTLKRMTPIILTAALDADGPTSIGTKEYSLAIRI